MFEPARDETQTSAALRFQFGTLKRLPQKSATVAAVSDRRLRRIGGLKPPVLGSPRRRSETAATDSTKNLQVALLIA